MLLSTLQVNFLGSLLLDVRRMLPPDRSPCRMLRLCKYARALAISFAVSLHSVQHESLASKHSAAPVLLVVQYQLITGQHAHTGKQPSAD